MIIYLFLFSLTLLLSYLLAFNGVRKLRYNHIQWNNYIVWSFIIILLFIGLRYNVGRDYPAYAGDYTYTTLDDFGQLFSKYKIEYGFYGILVLARTFSMGPIGLFIIGAYISLYLFYRLFRNNPEFLPIGIIVFFVGLSYSFVINGLRQGITIFLFLNAAKQLVDEGVSVKNFLKFACCLLVGALFHTSIVYLCILYILKIPILQKFINRNTLCAIAVSGLILNTLGFVEIFVPEVESGEGYSYEAMMETEMFVVESEGISMGKLLTLLVYLLPLWFYDKIKEIYPQYKIYFVFLSLGSALFFLFPDNMLVTRVAYYFLFSEVLVYPIFFHYTKYFCKLSYRSLFRYFIIIGWILLFIVNFSFFYENQLWPNARILGIPIN